MPFWRLRSGPSCSSLGPQRSPIGVAHRVADDGADDDHGDDGGQVHPALGGQHAAEDGGRLAGEDEAEHHGRLGEDQQADQRVGRPPVQREQRLEQTVDHGAAPARCSRAAHGPAARAAVSSRRAACTRAG